MKQFGGKLTRDLKDRYGKSPNWRAGKFTNLEVTKMDLNLFNAPKIIYEQIFQGKGREPKQPIPIKPFELSEKGLESNRTLLAWFGHSALFVRMGGLNILIDPMLGPNASPISPFKTKRFSRDVIAIIDQLPPIDILLLTHDHYDHLDLESIERLKRKVRKFYVALGCSRHFEEWGIEPSLITEFDWWDNQNEGGLEIIFTPTRHFSGRGLKDQSTSLWGGWVLSGEREKIYFSGDGGYGSHFSEIGKRLGPFDLGIMECGQYNEHWHQIHMYPEESVQAGLDAGAKKLIPVHWAGFALSLHSWKDPIVRFQKEAELKGIKTLTPELGEMFEYKNFSGTEWWDKLD